MGEGGNHCTQRPHGRHQYRCDIFSGKCKQAKEPLDTVELEELPDSRERAGAPVLWLSCEGQIDVWEMYSDNSYLSAILDQQGLQVAAPINLGTKKAESFSPQLLQGFWHKLKKNNPKIVVMSPTVETELQKARSGMTCVWTWQNIKFLAENTSLFWDQIQERFGV